MIADNIKQVEDNIRTACKLSGRDEKEVTLIAVSKTKPISMLEEAYASGCRHFGENKVQELADKFEQMPKDIKWHMIGHLQRNKVKYLIGKTVLIHSVDSLRLAEEINKEAQKKEITVDILLEVNIGGEESKFGTDAGKALLLAESISKLQNLRIRGLMTIAPFVENPTDNRHIFTKLRQLSVDIKNKNIDNVTMGVLSMGMTGDYQVAVQEGATLVRVGTGIFGERQINRIES